MKTSLKEAGACNFSLSGSFPFISLNVSALNAVSINLFRWYGLDLSPMTATLNSKDELFTQNAVLYLSSSLIGIMKKALEMSMDTTILFFSVNIISSAVVNEVCCGNSRHVFSSLKSRHMRYSAEWFCSPVSLDAFVFSLSSSLLAGLGTSTTLLRQGLSDSRTTPDSCNCFIACIAKLYLWGGKRRTFCVTILPGSVGSAASYRVVVSRSSFDLLNLSS